MLLLSFSQGCTSLSLADTCDLQASLVVVDLIDAMEALSFPDATVDLVAELFGLQDSVTLAELRSPVDAATIPGRDLIRLRCALDPAVRACMSMCMQCVPECACEWLGCPHSTLSRAVMCVALCWLHVISPLWWQRVAAEQVKAAAAEAHRLAEEQVRRCVVVDGVHLGSLLQVVG
jgi:hypothetical protein